MKPIVKPRYQRTASWRGQTCREEPKLATDVLRQQCLQRLRLEHPAKFAQILRLLDLASTAPIGIINQGIRSIENALIVQQSSQEKIDR